MLSPIDYWRFHEDLTVIQAALLILGIDPAELQDSVLDIYAVRPAGFDAVLSSLQQAILNDRLKATVRHPVRYVENPDNRSWVQYPKVDEECGVFNDPEHGKLDVHFKKTPDWTLTTVEVEELKAWLLRRNSKPSFFFGEASTEPDYLNKNHPRYSAKLAATIQAWMAMDDENLLEGKAVKAALADWLESRYKELGLIYDGDKNKTGIEECVKVANWKDKGGATKTPER